MIVGRRTVEPRRSRRGLEDSRLTQTLRPIYDSQGRQIFVPAADPRAAQTLKPVYDKNGQPIYVPGKDPSKFQHPDNSFFAYIEALIVSSSAKTLAQPTLLVQEGETAEVERGRRPPEK